MVATATARGTMCARSAGIARRRLRGWNNGASISVSGTPVNISATTSAWGAVRNLNLHEFPTMELMRDHGIRTPRSYLASDPEEVRELFRRNFSKGMYVRTNCNVFVLRRNDEPHDACANRMSFSLLHSRCLKYYQMLCPNALISAISIQSTQIK
jgi:hypothetical protein